MMKIALDRIVSITEARRRLSELVDAASADEFWVLTKGGKPQVALVDVAYLDQLIRRARFNDLSLRSQSTFERYLRDRGLDPETIDPEEAEAILQDY